MRDLNLKAGTIAGVLRAHGWSQSRSVARVHPYTSLYFDPFIRAAPTPSTPTPLCFTAKPLHLMLSSSPLPHCLRVLHLKRRNASPLLSFPLHSALSTLLYPSLLCSIRRYSSPNSTTLLLLSCGLSASRSPLLLLIYFPFIRPSFVRFPPCSSKCCSFSVYGLPFLGHPFSSSIFNGTFLCVNPSLKPRLSSLSFSLLNYLLRCRLVAKEERRPRRAPERSPTPLCRRGREMARPLHRPRLSNGSRWRNGSLHSGRKPGTGIVMHAPVSPLQRATQQSTCRTSFAGWIDGWDATRLSAESLCVSNLTKLISSCLEFHREMRDEYSVRRSDGAESMRGGEARSVRVRGWETFKKNYV